MFVLLFLFMKKMRQRVKQLMFIVRLGVVAVQPLFFAIWYAFQLLKAYTYSNIQTHSIKIFAIIILIELKSFSPFSHC